MGDAGAPVAEEEIPLLREAFELLADELHPDARTIVNDQGLVKKTEDGYELACRDNRECIFVDYSDDGTAFCTIQKACFEGRTDWEKPLSCHLYPLRLKRSGDFDYANFEYVDRLCAAACSKGKDEETYLSDFLKKPLIRRYGKQWYLKFKEACEEIRTPNRKAVTL